MSADLSQNADENEVDGDGGDEDEDEGGDVDIGNRLADGGEGRVVEAVDHANVSSGLMNKCQ
jgi:hypothetical protein